MSTHDYVIVGAGSAGSVVAARLTEAGRSVLLLEAGGSDKDTNVSVPAAFSKLFRTERDWDFSSGPEPFSGGRELYVPRGKMLGGSSSMNAMIYIRGHRQDYEDWVSLGAKGWSYDDVLPYFRKSENNERGSDDYHGVGGPLNVADLRSPTSLTLRFVEAAMAVGHPVNPDFNGAEQLGVGQYQVTQKKGSRHSAASAYLKPAMSRPNLTIAMGALAHRVVIENGRALGVEYEKDGGLTRAYADAEVILCGGAVNTPQLLMLSGIGPADHLVEQGIAVVVGNPDVGDHLMDHPVIGMSWATSAGDSLENAETLGQLMSYLLRRKGLLTSNVGEAGGFFKVLGTERATDLQLHFGPAYFQDHGFETHEGNAFTIGPTLVAPKSRGRLRLGSADPTAKPVMVGNHLREQSDIDILVAGLDLAREVASAPPLADVNLGALKPADELVTKADKEAWIRRHVELLYHPSCTARMGPDGDAVVDPELRVYGVENLRVADASVMPVVTRGNTNATTIMIGERAADMILESS